jgi:hypothetical protein
MSVWRWMHRHALWLHYWSQTCYGIHILNSGDTCDPVWLCIMCPKVYQKCSCHLNILGATKQTWSKFHAEDPQIFGASYIKFSIPSDLEPEIFCLVCNSVYRWAILHGDHKLVIQTNTVVSPNLCQVVGEGVWGCSVENSSPLNMRLYCQYNYSTENKVPAFTTLLSRANTSPLPSKSVVQRTYEENVWIRNVQI